MKFHKKHIITLLCFGIIAATTPLLGKLFPEGEIYLTHSDSPNFHIIEVKAKDLAQPFFGTSFHLHFNQNQYEYDHFSLGSFFEESDPLVQIAKSGDVIMVGLSLKRGSLIKNKEGTLLKLFFKTNETRLQPHSFSLSNAVYSTYDNGRKDIDSVRFSE